MGWLCSERATRGASVAQESATRARPFWAILKAVVYAKSLGKVFG